VLEFVEAEFEYDRYFSTTESRFGEPNLVLGIRLEFRIAGAVASWVSNANKQQIRKVAKYILESIPPVPFPPSFRCVGDRVELHWRLLSLEDAMMWMVWQDTSQRYPVQFCEECRKVFRPRSAHRRKYCDSETCGHRVAAREYKRRRRAKRQERA
jgi:hypothetical protein